MGSKVLKNHHIGSTLNPLKSDQKWTIIHYSSYKTSSDHCTHNSKVSFPLFKISEIINKEILSSNLPSATRPCTTHCCQVSDIKLRTRTCMSLYVDISHTTLTLLHLYRPENYRLRHWMQPHLTFLMSLVPSSTKMCLFRFELSSFFSLCTSFVPQKHIGISWTANSLRQQP